MDVLMRAFTEKDWTDLLTMVLALYNEDPEGEPMNEAKLARTVNQLYTKPKRVQL